MHQSTPALAITGLKKTYAGGATALNGVTLNIPQGGFYALLGPNGAGKTTLIGSVVGLVTPTAGTIEVFGINAQTHPEAAKACIGIVPQEVNFNPFDKCLDVVVNQAGYYGIPRHEALPRATALLQSLGLGDKLDQPGRMLSGGMKRRLLIARALVQRPKLLILDEPTAGVDVELRRSMWEFLQGLVAEGMTILLTTHYLEEAESLCKNIAIMHKGAVVMQGSMADVLAVTPATPHSKTFKGGRLEEVFLHLTSSPAANNLNEHSLKA